MQSKREVLKYCTRKWKKRTLVSTPTEGWIRYEWHAAKMSQIVPVNWETSGYDVLTTIGFSIDDAYNSITKHALDLNVEWVIIVEDDVLIPVNTYVKFNEYQQKGTIPVVSGVYYLKAVPTIPLVFRGRGNGAFTKWKPGEKVWCDGLPMGCLMLHTSILKWMWEHTEDYTAGNGEKLRRVFWTPQRAYFDPESNCYNRQAGTQDLYFFDQLLENKVLEKTGWKKLADKEFPFLCDTSIFCKHICRQTGRQYP